MKESKYKQLFTVFLVWLISCLLANSSVIDEQTQLANTLARSKSIANKDKTALYKRVSAQLVTRGYKARTQKGIKQMWNLLYGEYLRAKDIMKTKSGVKAMKNSPWVVAIADAMKRCDIEADLDDMVLDSQDLNLDSRYDHFVRGGKVDLHMSIFLYDPLKNIHILENYV